MRVTILVAGAILLGACAGGPGGNVNCQWPPDHDSRPLQLSASSDRRHLADDAQTAEDLAIRHADARHGRAQHSRDRREYQTVREGCKATLFAVVAGQHNVSVDAVAVAVADRREWLDALVILAFAILFALVAQRISAYMLRGAFADSRLLAASMLLVAALAAGAVGALSGGVWFALIESLRVGNGHMSYRVERAPIRQHPLLAFAGCSILFAAVSVAQYRNARP